jgi:integrase
MKVHLTKKFIDAQKPPASGRSTFTDTLAPGLTLRITPNDARSWIVRYRPKGEAQRYAVLGPYSDEAVTLADARQRAMEITGAAKKGTDLIAEERRRVEMDREARARARSLSDLADDYIAHCNAHLKSADLIAGRLRNHILPALGGRQIGELRRADLVELLDRLEHERGLKHQVNRVRETLRALFAFAIERQLIDANPMVGTRKRKLEQPRERILTPVELRSIWQGCDRLPAVRATFIRALILTGARRNEVRELRWREINDDRLWVLPSGRSKNARAHEIPLSDQMVDVLAALPRCGEFVFSTDGERPIGGTSWIKKAIDQESGVTDWRFHDLRRTLRSGLSELGIAYEIAERVIGHTVPALERTYNLHSFRTEKARALQAWANHVSFIVGDGRDTNVVSLRAGG